jgi:hypothetical protein
VRGTETIALKPGQVHPGAILTRRASEGTGCVSATVLGQRRSLARRVGLGTAVGERITFLTLNEAVFPLWPTSRTITRSASKAIAPGMLADASG